MLSETLSGKCPCCSYDKLLQRYGSLGYNQLDGCPNCGFGYSSNGSSELFGEDAWLNYGNHVLSSHRAGIEVPFPEKLNQIIKEKGSVGSDNEHYKEHHEKFDEAYYRFNKEHNDMSKENLRKMIFEWAEKQERCNDVEDTVFKYSEEDVKKHLSTNPVIFKLKSTK